jgi:CubicO group peptidase (beta-lactamase class C family)
MSHLQRIADLIEQQSIGLLRQHGRIARRSSAVCVLVAVVAGCAPLVQTGLCDAVASGASSVERTACAVPRFSEGGPDAEAYSASKGYPVGDRSNWHLPPFLVGSHSHFDQIFEGRTVRPARIPSPLKRAAAEPVLRYQYQGQSHTLDDYLARNHATGLLVAQGDAILVERYQYARTDQHRFASWSMAKTVTAMLVGIAIAEGHIRSIDDHAAAYVPALAGTEYGRTSLRHLLQMSSGVRFVEDYVTRGSDARRLGSATFGQGGPGGVDAVRPFNVRAVPSGTKSSYASVETQVLGLVLRSAIARPVADYLQEKIWEPMGAEASATWLVDRSGQEVTYCCLNAVLRDYARLGLLLAHDGNWRGRQLIPRAWIEDATSVSPDQPHLRPGTAMPFWAYGYQVRIFPGERRMFVLDGFRGQRIFVDPASRLVMVHTAVRTQDRDSGDREENALWQGLVRELGTDRRSVIK